MMLLMPAAAQTPAFPGAEGAGAWATGGRGGKVYRVTNLNATGPGSLADAVSAPGRIVVFAVSGTIDLKGGRIQLAHPNITIAGQTAPGEGISIRGGALVVSAGNVILRHLRIRRGFNEIGDSGDALTIKGRFERVIADHVSTSWATDENLTLTNADKITAQYSIAAEGLDYFNPNQSPNRHSEGSLFGSQTPGGQVTVHHTVYAHNRLRNCRTTGADNGYPLLDFRNNVIYNARELTTHTGSQPVHLNLVNNYYKDGPSTELPIRGVIFTFMSDVAHRLYAAGNYAHGHPPVTADNWRGVRYNKGVTEATVRTDRPIATPPVTTETAQQAFANLLDEAGAILPARDAVDLRILRDVRNGTGAIVNFETDIPESGRWQTYHGLPAPADSDGDGMPDYWERQFGVEDPAADSDSDGYTDIEEYLNNTDPRGGALPVVYVSASISRAWRKDGAPGELRFWRAGPADAPLEVRYTLDGRPRAVTIPRGARWAAVAVPPDERRIVVASVAPAPAYHTGCPQAALVAIEDGASPAPVDIAKVDPEGGVSAAVRRAGERNMEEHKKNKQRERHPK